MRQEECRQSMSVIKDMRGDRDGLVRTLVKLLMVAGHSAFIFCVCVWGGREQLGVCERQHSLCALQQCKVAV